MSTDTFHKATIARQRDIVLLFTTRTIRLFGYGLVSVVLVLYLKQLHFSDLQTGGLLTLTLIGDTLISLWITTRADRLGRKHMLILGGALMLLAGIVFVFTENFFALLFAATIGVISPSGSEVGPFLSIEQAALSHLVHSHRRTAVFAWYNLAGSLATATGALVAGFAVMALQAHGMNITPAYQIILLGYAGVGGILMVLFCFVSPMVEIHDLRKKTITGMFLGLHRSKRIVLKLSMLFSLDAFAGGFVITALIAYWFRLRWGTPIESIGMVIFGANILAGISALTASWMAKRIGLLNTMVFTHIPSNILLMLVPVMPTESLAIAVLLARFSISQMDVPTRQAYTMAVVDPDERSAAAGVTGAVRTMGASLSPFIGNQMLGLAAGGPLLGMIFFVSGGLKIVYDLLIWKNFRETMPRDDEPRGFPVTPSPKPEKP